MNLIDAVLAPFQRRSESLDPLDDRYYSRNWFSQVAGGRTTSGLHIDPHNALSNSVVWACTLTIAESIAMLPRELMKRKADGKVPAEEHPSYEMIAIQPNPETTKFDFEVDAAFDLLGYGNSISELVYDGRGYPIQMWRLNPERVKIVRNEKSKALDYWYQQDDHTWKLIPRMQIHHRRMPSRDGIIGMSVISLAANSIALGLSLEEYTSRLFENDASPRGILQHPDMLDAPAKANIREQWKLLHQGRANRHEIAVLDRGLEYKAVSMEPEKAQMIEGRTFQVPEICRWYRMKPHMVAHLADATFSNIGYQSQEFIRDVLNPHLRRIRESTERDCILPKERRKYSVEHRVEALLQGDFPEQNANIATGIQWGFMTPNEARKMKNMNPVEGGDQLIQPLNYAPVGMQAEILMSKNKAKTEEKPAEKEEKEPEKDEKPAKTEKKRALELVATTKDVFEPLFKDAFERIVSREMVAMERACKKLSKGGSQQEFDTWMTEFSQEHAQFVEKVVSPLVDGASTLAGAMTGSQKAELITDVVRAVVDTLAVPADGSSTRSGEIAKQELDRVFNRIGVQHES